MDCSPPGSSAHGILQARTLEWVAMPSFRRSFWPRDQTLVSCIAGRFFNIWAISEAHHVCKRQVFSSLAPHLWLRYVCDIHTIAPHFIAFLCIALHGYCVFLQTEGLWQPCVVQAYRLHFSNSICSLRVCVTSWEFLQYFRLLLALYLLWWSVISDLWCNCCKKIISRWMLRWWLIDFSNILKLKYVLFLDIILSHT